MDQSLVVLYGAPGLTVAAVAMAILIPLVNVLCIAVLARHGDTRVGDGTSCALPCAIR